MNTFADRSRGSMIDATEHDDDLSPESAAAIVRWRIVSRLIIWAAIGATAAVILRVEPLLSANDRSRWLTVWSLVERNTYVIDEAMQMPGWDTIDKVRHDGYFYSSKPPLLSAVVAEVYRAVKWVTDWNLTDDTARVTRVILLLVNLLPMFFALRTLADMATRYGENLAARSLFLLAAAGGTFLTPYLVTLNNHTVAAMAVIFAMSSLLRIVVDGSRSPRDFVQTGFFAALACTAELPAAAFGLLTFLLLVRKAPMRTLTWYAVAALIPLGAYFWTNYVATGGIKPFYAYYGTEKYEYVHEGVPSYWVTPQGIDANDESPAVYLMHCTIGHHGILSLTPVFLLTVIGWILPAGWRDPRLRLVQGLSILLTVLVLGFYLTRTANYNYGGNTAGLRWTFWLIPFWLLGLLTISNQWGMNRFYRCIAGVLLACSVASSAQSLSNPWQGTWLYNLMSRLEWFDYGTPHEQFPRPLTCRIASLPAVEDRSRNWIEFAAVSPTGVQDTLRIADAGRIDFQGQTARQLTFTWDAGLPNEFQQTLTLLEEPLLAGKRVESVLVWPNGRPDRVTRYVAQSFLRNLPRTRGYNPDRIRYERTALQADALRCQMAAAQTTSQQFETAPVFSYRSKLWLCDRVPFGVLRVDTVIHDSASEPVHYHRMDAVAAGWLRPESDEDIKAGGTELR